MAFQLPQYFQPDFSSRPLASAPVAKTAPAPSDGVAPDGFHATSNHPEYVHLSPGHWQLVARSRMDCVMVLRGTGFQPVNRAATIRERSEPLADARGSECAGFQPGKKEHGQDAHATHGQDARATATIEVIEPRRLRKDDLVFLGRTENGEDGIYVHSTGFQYPANLTDKFAFRTRGTRETPFSRSYDELYDLLRYDRKHGYIVWVLGPAVAFDKDSRQSMQALIEQGYCHALLAGNALATHDLEGARFRTGLGQDIYTQEPHPLGHYHHLDVLNAARRAGSIPALLAEWNVHDGIIWACTQRKVPFVLAGSIRDDGPLPEVIANVYEAQDAMREHAQRATAVIALATQLHTIAVGNMTPSFQLTPDGGVRPVYFYVVDMSEFSTDKLANRGSHQATAILTNVQDFLINLSRNLSNESNP